MEQYLQCPNGKCGRHNVLIPAWNDSHTAKRKFCQTCGTKLRTDKWSDKQSQVGKGDDRPPAGYVNGKGSKQWRKPELVMPTPVAMTEMEDSWSCNPDVKGCPVYKGKPQVEIPVEMWNEWVFMARQVKTEWFAYLKGEQVGNGHYRVTEMYFPKQRVSAATVVPEEREVLEGTIGAVHSHVEMTAVFSSVDERHWSQQVEIVVNARGEQDNRIRVQLDCGRWERFPGTVMLTNVDGVMAKVKELEGKFVEGEQERPPLRQNDPQRQLPSYYYSEGGEGWVG